MCSKPVETVNTCFSGVFPKVPDAGDSPHIYVDILYSFNDCSMWLEAGSSLATAQANRIELLLPYIRRFFILECTVKGWWEQI